VAVREGNDILGINACSGPVTLIRHLEDPTTPTGKADIVQGYHHRDYCPKYEVANLLFKINHSVDFSLFTYFYLMSLMTNDLQPETDI